MEVTLLDSERALRVKALNFPQYIEFQTNSLCNGNCIICPYENKAKKYPHQLMSNELIDKIINELNTHKSEIMRVIPYLNNEPSLDDRMIEVLRKIKRGGHFIELSTNMSGITKKKADIIIKERLVDEFRISFFGGTPEIYKKMMPGLEYDDIVEKTQYFLTQNDMLGKPICIKIVMVLYPKIDCMANLRAIKQTFPSADVLTFGFLDRANNLSTLTNQKILVEQNDNKQYILKGCDLNRPFERMCILSNGKVVFCSQDWDREVELGNICHQSIAEIWNNDHFLAERNRLIGLKQTPEAFLCRRCKLAHILDSLTGEEYMNFIGDEYVDETDKIKYDELLI